MRKLQKICGNQSGGMLIITIGVLAVLAMLVVTLVGVARQSLHVTRHFLGRSLARQQAHTGFELALGLIDYCQHTFGKQIDYDFHLPDELEVDFTHLESSQVDALPGDASNVHLSDEKARLSLNFASREELLRLPGLTESMVDAILDWRDPDDNPRKNGAESDWYLRQPAPYRAKNEPLESAEELLLIKGITPVVFDRIAPLVTVYGGREVNLNTSPVAVLVALGLGEELARQLVDLRDGPDNQDGTTDDFFFSNADSICLQLERRSLCDARQLGQLRHLIQTEKLTVSSNYSRVRVTAYAAKDSSKSTITAVVKRDDRDHFAAVFWRES